MTTGIWEFEGQGNRGETGGQREKGDLLHFYLLFPFLGILDFHLHTTASHNMQAKSFWTPHFGRGIFFLFPGYAALTLNTQLL